MLYFRLLLAITFSFILFTCDEPKDNDIMNDDDTIIILDENNDGYHDKDFEFLQILIDNSGLEIDPLELGYQEWKDGRLIELNCHRCDLEGEIPPEIGNLSILNQLDLSNNQLSGIIPDEICNLNLEWNSVLFFNISYNNLCPPYPECIEEYIGDQDTTGCE